MNRILLIDRDRTLGASLGMACLERGIAIRMAETFCEGVRYLMNDAPTTAVLVDAAALTMAGADRVRIFDAVAPGVPVIVTVKPGTPVEEHVRYELQGFRVLAKPFAPEDVLDKIEWAEKPRPARREAAVQVRAICG
jgi:DNA-binding NtrC family response regulator